MLSIVVYADTFEIKNLVHKLIYELGRLRYLFHMH